LSFDNPGNRIINNVGWGILCAPPPSNPLWNGPRPTVSGNTGGPISTFCKMGN